MKLSMSNIAWEKEKNGQIYAWMKEYQYAGIEIAPTKIFSKNPYDNCEKAKKWKENIKEKYGIVISSMQSIWFGRQEKVFGSKEERKILQEYTKKAIDFAKVLQCHNLVFGCPKNRIFPQEGDKTIGISFFRELGEYAYSQGTVIAMEANPAIYGTNYMNETKEVFELIEQVDSKGFRLNLDVGTMIYNQEEITELTGRVELINHVHISEPWLKLIEKRELHNNLANLLRKENYDGFVSIEMKEQKLNDIEKTMKYVREVFQ